MNQNTESLRSYSHPVDASIIRVLANPATHIVIKRPVQLSADASCRRAP